MYLVFVYIIELTIIILLNVNTVLFTNFIWWCGYYNCICAFAICIQVECQIIQIQLVCYIHIRETHINLVKTLAHLQNKIQTEIVSAKFILL